MTPKRTVYEAEVHIANLAAEERGSRMTGTLETPARATNRRGKVRGTPRASGDKALQRNPARIRVHSMREDDQG